MSWRLTYNETLEINQPTTINISYAKNVKPVLYRAFSP